METMRDVLFARALHPAMIALCLGVAACTVVRGSGTVVTEERRVEAFTEIELEGSGTVLVALGERSAVTVEADDNVVPLLRTEVEGGRLHLGSKSGTSFISNAPIVFRVTTPSLEQLVLSGSGDVQIGDLAGGDLEVRIDGSGEVVATGTVERLRVVVSGSGTFGGFELQAAEVDVRVDGSGDVEVFASEKLGVEINGSGVVEYAGEPDDVETRVSGSGDVEEVRR